MKSEKAIELFFGGFNCAQSVFSVFSCEYGIDEETACRLSCGFGGGMGGMQNICGAVTGAFMVLGLEYGYGISNESYKKSEMYSIIKTYCDKFIAENSKLSCIDLVGCDLNTHEGRKYFKDNDIKNTVCARCVKSAVFILQEFLDTSKQ